MQQSSALASAVTYNCTRETLVYRRDARSKTLSLRTMIMLFKTNNTCASAMLAFVSALLPLSAEAADCDRNFTSSGNFLSGQIFRTVAELPNVSADSAYDSAYQAIAKQGFSIGHADRNARVISALNSGSRPERQIPLNATIERAQHGATISLNFSTPPGAFASEEGIKAEFCKIVAAAAVERHQDAQPGSSHRQENGMPVFTASANAPRICLANACIGMTLEEAGKLNLKSTSNPSNFSPINSRLGYYGLDANGKLIAMNTSRIDSLWIRQYLQSVRTMCVTPGRLHAETSTSDGTPVRLGFDLTTQYGKVEYVLRSITRGLPDHMSASERKNFENEVRQRYGRAFIETGDIARNVKANNGELGEAVVMLNPSFLELLGPGRPQGTLKLMEQPGCSNKARLD